MTIDRKTFIGGSDVAAVLGLSPWPNATPLATFMRKKGLIDTDAAQDESRARILRRGRKLEPYVIDTLEEVYGIKVTKRSRDDQGEEGLNRYKDPHLPFLACEIDFEWEVTPEIAEDYDIDRTLIGTVQNGEVKTHHPRAFYAKYGQAGTDEVPIEYAAQALHGLGITGRKLTMIAVMVGADDPLIYWVKREDDVINGMRARLRAFWHDHVEAGRPPTPVNIEDCWRLFRQRPTSVTEATLEVVELVAQYKAAQERAKAAAEGAETLKFQILAAMLGDEEARAAQLKAAAQKGKHLLTFGGRELLTVAYQEKATLDQKGIRKDHPEIAEQFERISSFYVVRQKRSQAK